MVAAGIAARGLHVDGIALVIHADPPAGHKAHVHRSGRTARGGAAGTVATVQTAAQAARLKDLVSGRPPWVCRRAGRACGQVRGASTRRGGVYWSWL